MASSSACNGANAGSMKRLPIAPSNSVPRYLTAAFPCGRQARHSFRSPTPRRNAAIKSFVPKLWNLEPAPALISSLGGENGQKAKKKRKYSKSSGMT